MSNRSIFTAVFCILLAFVLGISDANAWFRMKNSTNKRMSVAFQWHKPNCDGSKSNWEVAGWWILNPDETKTVYGSDLQDTNRYYYYYVFDESGTEWSGPYSTCVPMRQFDWCDNICDTAPDTRNAGFREIDIGSNNNYTLNLTP